MNLKRKKDRVFLDCDIEEWKQLINMFGLVANMDRVGYEIIRDAENLIGWWISDCRDRYNKKHKKEKAK